MAYEAMLAGLEMIPFWEGIRAKELEPKIGKEPMTYLYTLLEYAFFIKWEDHSKGRPPLLGDLPLLDYPPLLDSEGGPLLPEGSPPLRTSEKPRTADDFSRSVLVSFSLVPILSLNKATKGLPSQTSQANFRTPEIARICVPAQGFVLYSFRTPTRIVDRSPL